MKEINYKWEFAPFREYPLKTLITIIIMVSFIVGCYFLTHELILCFISILVFAGVLHPLFSSVVFQTDEKGVNFTTKGKNYSLLWEKIERYKTEFPRLTIHEKKEEGKASYFLILQFHKKDKAIYETILKKLKQLKAQLENVD